MPDCEPASESQHNDWQLFPKTSYLTASEKVVTPAEAGVQFKLKQLKIQYFSLHRDDDKGYLATFYERIMI